MGSAMQKISTDKTVRSKTVQDLKDFKLQSLIIQAKKGEKLVSMMHAIKRDFNLVGDYIVELHTEDKSSKNETGSYDKKRLEESEARLLQHFEDEKRATLFLFRMKKQMNKKN